VEEEEKIGKPSPLKTSKVSRVKSRKCISRQDQKKEDVEEEEDVTNLQEVQAERKHLCDHCGEEREGKKAGRRKKKLPQLPKGRRRKMMMRNKLRENFLPNASLALQRVRQQSLLEELKEACSQKGDSGSSVSEFLASVAESEADIKLPPSFILNLVKGEASHIGPYTVYPVRLISRPLFPMGVVKAGRGNEEKTSD